MPQLTIGALAFDMDSQQTPTTATAYTNRVGVDPSAWPTARFAVTAGNMKTRSRVRSSLAVPTYDAAGLYLGMSLATISVEVPAGAILSHRTTIGTRLIDLATDTSAAFGKLKPNPVDADFI